MKYKIDYHMRRVFCFAILLAFETFCYSQSISVSSFKLLDTDLTANTAGTMEQDQNGETAALIKVVTTQTGFTFDGGSMGIVKTKQTPGEIWVYIPRGSKKISIKHPELGVLRDYYFPIAIEAARTYEMTLVAGEIQTIVKQTSNTQYLVIKVTPQDAVVELNNEILPTSNGIAQKFVKLGTYEYRVQAQDYHTTAGVVTIDDPKNKKVLEINLQPAFGWIEFPSHEEYNGAQVFIDNSLAGYIPMKSKNLSSGSYSIKIIKDLYNPFSQNVIVKDNETTIVTPLLISNYSFVSINVEKGADIYINEEKKGSGMWKGKLSPGNYLLEAKKNGHRSTFQNIEITNGQQDLNIQLPTPTPLFGDANITSVPPLADLFVDDSLMGKTPAFIPQIAVGNHKILFKHEGYRDFSDSICICENKNTSYNAELIELTMCEVIVRCNVPDAILVLDGKDILNLAELKKLEVGSHDIKVVAEGFMDQELKINVENTSANVINVELIPDKLYLNKETFPWEKICITSDPSVVQGLKRVGDVSDKFAHHGDSPTMYEYKMQLCLNRIKKKAAKMGGTIVLTKSPKSGKYIKIRATAYK